MKKRKKYIILSLLTVLNIGGATRFYFYNKEPIPVRNSQAKKVDAIQLYQSFLTDPAEAKKNDANKIRDLSGSIKQVSKNL